MSGPTIPPNSQPTWPGIPPPPPSRWQRTRQVVRSWWNGGVWQKVALLAVVPLLCACVTCSGLVLVAASPFGGQVVRQGQATDTAQAVATAQTNATAAAYALLHPKPTTTPKPATATPRLTVTPTPKATATPRAAPTPTNTPVSLPTATPVPPTATPVPQDCLVICNPWGYDFNPGNLIYNPASGFCSVFPCIANFPNGNGYVVECTDGKYSKSGGIQGACSYHGGIKQALYSH